MSYTKSTVTSRNRARTPLGTAAAELGNYLAKPFFGDESGRRASSASAVPRVPLRSRVDSGPYADAKRARKESRTVHAAPVGNGERVRLSRELTAQCEAVVDRAQALLERAEEQGERLHATLRASLERTPRGSLSPQQSSAAATPSPRAGRWSGMFGTPRAPTAPPPTPSRPDAGAGAAGEREGASGTVGVAGAWVRRLLSGSPDASAGRAERERSIAGASDATTPQRGESPRRSRKSVAFKDPDSREGRTPPHALEETRASTVYPPAPPPSAVKHTPPRSAEPAEPAVPAEDAEDAEEVGRRLGSEESETKSEAEAEGSTEETSEDEDEEKSVAEILREYPRSRAYRILTKAALVEYAKEHHIVLSLKSTKKELFDVARKLAICEEQPR